MRERCLSRRILRATRSLGRTVANKTAYSLPKPGQTSRCRLVFTEQRFQRGNGGPDVIRAYSEAPRQHRIGRVERVASTDTGFLVLDVSREYVHCPRQVADQGCDLLPARGGTIMTVSTGYDLNTRCLLAGPFQDALMPHIGLKQARSTLCSSQDMRCSQGIRVVAPSPG